MKCIYDLYPGHLKYEPYDRNVIVKQSSKRKGGKENPKYKVSVSGRFQCGNPILPVNKKQTYGGLVNNLS